MASAAYAYSASDLAQVRAETVPVALELARLGAAAQFLTHLRDSQGERAIDLLQSFAIARTAMQHMQAALQEDRADDASERLELLRTETARLRHLVAVVDETTTVAATETFIAARRPASAELRRMIEYHALVAERSETSRAKLVSFAMALLRREPISGRQPRLIRNVLLQHKILPGTLEELDPALIEEAATLRRRIADARERALEPTQAALWAYRSALGEALYTTGGLSQMLALELALTERTDEVRREVARGFDALLEDLDGVVEEDPGSLSTPGGAESEELGAKAMRALLLEVESDFSAATASGDFEFRGIFLEPPELDAIRAGLSDENLAALLRLSAVHRTAMDRLARRHSKSSKTAEQDQEPISRQLAAALLRQASAIEADLDDLNQRSIMHGDIDTAKIVTRCAHRMARTRLGLALLADLPPEGSAPEHDPVGPSSEGRSTEAAGDGLESQLAHAKLFRDALLGDCAPADPGATSKADRTIAARGAAAAKAAEPKPRISRKQRKVLVTVAVLTLGFHGVRLAALSGEKPKGPRPSDFHAPIALSAVNPIRGTLVARTDETWSGSEEDQRARLTALWQEARDKGYDHLVLVAADSGRPVAVADREELRLLDRLPSDIASPVPTE